MGEDKNLIIEDGEEVVILLEEEEENFDETGYIDTKLVQEELASDANAAYAEMRYTGEATDEDNFVYEDEIIYEEEPVIDIGMTSGFPENIEENAETSEEYEDDEESFLGSIGSKLVIGMGIIVALLAIFVGVFLLKDRIFKSETVDFSEVGVEVVELGLVGGDNVEAITAAQGSRLEELYEAVKNYDYDEADEETGVTTVSLTLTSILKDLKIKFVNKKDKLIANVPFQVEVTDASGKSQIITDTDKDGIVYLTDLEGGAYTVKLIKLEGYDSYYDFGEGGTQSVSVKSQIDYKKVDVSNEIKKTTDAVSAKEDTKKQETTVESKLTDTVGYVMSSKTLVSDAYNAIDKATKVTDPITTIKKAYEIAGGSRFYRLSEIGSADTSTDSCSHTEYIYKSQGDGTHVHVCKDCGNSDGNAASHCDYDENGKCKQCGSESSHKHSYTYTYDAQVPGKHTATCSNSDGNCFKTTVSETCTYESGVCKLCGQKKTASFALKSIDIQGEKTLKITEGVQVTESVYKVVPTYESGAPKSISYKWEVVEGPLVLIFANGNTTSESVSILPASLGKGKLRCTLEFALEDGTSTTQMQTIDIEVISSGLNLSHEGKKLLLIGDDEITVSAKLPEGSKDKLKWVVSDADAISVQVSEDTHSAKVKAKNKPGTQPVITVSFENDAKTYKQVTFVVMTNPKNDKVTKLLDNEGKQLYVYEASSKTYREAVYADYYTADKLYVGGVESYKYTGWWKIDGKTYYFDANGKKVTGDQVINGAKYSFDSDGALKNGTGTFGIDVSVWNGTIDWTKVAKSGVNYAIIRCGFRGSSEGGLYADSKFTQNISNATQAGIKVGVYFFTQAITEAEAVEEASMCLKLVDGYNLAYPIFIDVEASGGRADGLSKDQRTAIVNAFCKTITNSGYKAGVYANKNWFENKLNTSSLTGYTIWLAQYASKATYSSTRYDLWQYSSKGSISGISGDVDLNLSYVGY